jgi:hypothetical protein
MDESEVERLLREIDMCKTRPSDDGQLRILASRMSTRRRMRLGAAIACLLAIVATGVTLGVTHTSTGSKHPSTANQVIGNTRPGRGELQPVPGGLACNYANLQPFVNGAAAPDLTRWASNALTSQSPLNFSVSSVPLPGESSGPDVQSITIGILKPGVPVGTGITPADFVISTTTARASAAGFAFHGIDGNNVALSAGTYFVVADVKLVPCAGQSPTTSVSEITQLIVS